MHDEGVGGVKRERERERGRERGERGRERGREREREGGRERKGERERERERGRERGERGRERERGGEREICLKQRPGPCQTDTGEPLFLSPAQKSSKRCLKRGVVLNSHQATSLPMLELLTEASC